MLQALKGSKSRRRRDSTTGETNVKTGKEWLQRGYASWLSKSVFVKPRQVRVTIAKNLKKKQTKQNLAGRL